MLNYIPKVDAHLNTSNIYVRLTILKSNVERLSKFRHSQDFKRLPFDLRRQVVNTLERQTTLLNAQQKTINDFEQLSFPFGNDLSSL